MLDLYVIQEDFARLVVLRDEDGKYHPWNRQSSEPESPGELFLRGEVDKAVSSASRLMGREAGRRAIRWESSNCNGMPPTFALKVLVEAVKRHGGNRAAASRDLGLTPQAVQIAIKKAGIPVPFASRIKSEPETNRIGRRERERDLSYREKSRARSAAFRERKREARMAGGEGMAA